MTNGLAAGTAIERKRKMEIKCTCGNKGCTTVIEVQKNTYSPSLRLSWEDKGQPRGEEIALDANTIIQLIRELKDALQEMA